MKICTNEKTNENILSQFENVIWFKLSKNMKNILHLFNEVLAKALSANLIQNEKNTIYNFNHDQ